MGDAFVAGSCDPSVLFCNPAGPAFASGSEIMLEHAVWFESINYEAGYNNRSRSAFNDNSFPVSMVLGLSFSSVGIDYVFVPYCDLGNTRHTDLRLRWGGGKS